jgi:glycerol kinase
MRASASPMTYVLALDQGTTSSRAILFDEDGQPFASAQREIRQIFPQPGWVEHDAMEIWASQLAVAQQVVQQLKDLRGPAAVDGIAAIGIANQRETLVIWDRASGRPIGNAIVWQDHRTAALCDELNQQPGFAQTVRSRTGLLVDAYFSATKIRWLLDTVPGARQQASQGRLACGTIDSWLVWNLTRGAEHVTDSSNASRTMLFNIHASKWDAELLALFDVPASILPRVVPSSGVVATTDPRLFGRAIPIAGLVGDQQAATLGQACFAPGMAKNTYGTGCFMLMNTGSRPVISGSRLLTAVGWQHAHGAGPPAYCLEGAVFMAGATVQWLRDGLQMIRTSAEVESLAAEATDTGDVYLVPAFAGLGAPHWDGHARGLLIGMTRGTGRAHIARAALEAIALQSADVFDAMARESGLAVKELRVDGGASRNDMLMQMQANFLGAPVVRPRVTETTALGAAYLAGIATGVWSGLQEVASQWQAERRFEPSFSADQRLCKLSRWHAAVERAGRWAA